MGGGDDDGDDHDHGDGDGDDVDDDGKEDEHNGDVFMIPMYHSKLPDKQSDNEDGIIGICVFLWQMKTWW